MRRWRRGCHPLGTAGAGDGGQLCPGTGFPESRGRWEGTAGDSAASLGTGWQGTGSPSSVTGQLTGVIRAGGSHLGQEKGTRGTSSPGHVIPIPNRPGCSSSSSVATEDAPGKASKRVRAGVSHSAVPSTRDEFLLMRREHRGRAESPGAALFHQISSNSSGNRGQNAALPLVSNHPRLNCLFPVQFRIFNQNQNYKSPGAPLLYGMVCPSIP